ncbi:hypothetical protein GUJ93_ZPchr0001g30894 [Zizania palustris]|uniref:Uncharacterized protein n=1 Tax=Zizania palustris TaxID=103762 RepID=A0A8J5RVN6_ZIZPA|nr:hypothetical protein GUJ93_ZPchr0001g29794 [Zizania palustris]KAG8052166.1 hypothetical protein GUJ93_ZPchr0001g30894 [Zizania palustris]
MPTARAALPPRRLPPPAAAGHPLADLPLASPPPTDLPLAGRPPPPTGLRTSSPPIAARRRPSAKRMPSFKLQNGCFKKVTNISIMRSLQLRSSEQYKWWIRKTYRNNGTKASNPVASQRATPIIAYRIV